jgi:hypothetical protein
LIFISIKSAFSPSKAHSAASWTRVDIGLPTERVSMTRMSASGNSCEAISADLTVPLTSADGWMQNIVPPDGIKLLNSWINSSGGGAAVLGNSLVSLSIFINVGLSISIPS